MGTLNFNEYLKKYSVLVNLFIIIFIALFSSKIIKSVIVSSVVSNINITKKTGLPNRRLRRNVGRIKNTARLINFRTITERNIFDVKVKNEEVKNEVVSQNVTVTPLSLVLEGTIVVTPKEKSIAIIKDKKANKVDIYLLHSVVQGAEIIEIDKDKVVLLRNGKKEILTLYPSNNKGDNNVANSGSNRSISQRLGNNKFRPPEFNNRRFDGNNNVDLQVNRISENSFEIDKTDFNNALSNMGPILTQARVVPYFANGKIGGYKIFNIKPTGIFAKLGLKNGDIIKSINGNSLSSPEKALQMFQYLKTEDSFEIVIKRYGRDRTLSYSLR